MTAPASEDRFAGWPAARARLVLAVLGAMLLAAALVPLTATTGPPAPAAASRAATVPAAAPRTAGARARDADLALYDRIIGRIGAGENYYAAAAAEHRAGGYPLRPGFAVRLPTLAYLDWLLGPLGQRLAAVLLLLGVAGAWWGRLGEEARSPAVRRFGTALVFLGSSLALNRDYHVLHELWAGLLLALAFALHRPGRRWGAALAAAALALAIREQSLPFVLLMAALALWRRDWREAAAWSALAGAFAALLLLHLHLVAAQVLPGDRPSPSWLALRGLGGWLADVVLSSPLRVLPHWLAGPLAVLMVLGWAGWRSAAGLFGTLLFLGYGAAFMVAGRADNFYWGAIVAPAMYIGLAFAPRALASLGRAALGRG